MKEKLLTLLKSNSLWTQIAATIIGAAIIWLISFLIGIFNGLDYISSIQWTWSILNIKINLLTILIILVVVVWLFRWNNKISATKTQKEYYTKEEINNKFKNMVTKSEFDGFIDVYDLRRLKNHPWHDIHSGHEDNIKSFQLMIWFGKQKKTSIKLKMELGV